MSQQTLIDEPKKAPSKPKPIELRSGHDYVLTTAALEARKEELGKLAKKNEEEGYSREARAIKADADAIEYHILPAFNAQRELPLVTRDELAKNVRVAITRAVTVAFQQLGDPKIVIGPAAIESRQTRLLEVLTDRITQFAIDTAHEAFNQGVAAREQTSEALALRAIDSLRPVGV